MHTATRSMIQENLHTAAPSVTDVVVPHSHEVAVVVEAVVLLVGQVEVDVVEVMVIKHRTKVHATVAVWPITMPTHAISL